MIFGNIMPNPLKQAVIKGLSYLNTAKLRLRGYEDYFNFPFDVNLPLNTHANQVFLESCKILDDLGCNYFVCDGTILGIYRDNRFIAHDNDIDVAIYGDYDITKIIKKFETLKYKVGRIVRYKGKVQQLIFYSPDNVIFDICFWRDGGDGHAYHFVPEVEAGRRQDKSYYEKKDFVTFLDRTIPTHFNIEKWLEEHYGSDWKIPRQAKGDWREDAKDIIK